MKSGKITITEDNYGKSKLVFKKVDEKKIIDYHDLHLTVDRLSLACWLERLWELGLDSTVREI